jgi:hypothetical protein
MQKVNVAAGKISGFISKLRAVKETNYYHLKSADNFPSASNFGKAKVTKKI